MKKIIKKLKIYPVLLEIYIDAQYVFLNYFICYIPCWIIRKLFYRLAGMKIGKKSRIHMGTKIISPKKISIGENTIINEACMIDGRGGLTIGCNVSISLYTMIISASHDKNSGTFEYYDKHTVIEDCVWIGARAIILEGSTLKERCIIGAGSVFKGSSEENGIYVGVPARIVGHRTLDNNYKLDFQPFFR